jgi:hypothetical protein
MNRTELKQKIKENVYQNAFGEISGDNLQRVLLDMVDYSNKANDENFEKEEIVIVNPQGYYVPSGVKINDIGSNLTAGENIKIEDDTISAIGYKYNEDKNSISIGGGEKTVTRTNNDITEEVVVEGKTQAVGKNSFASGFNSIAYGEGSHAEGGGIHSGSIGMSGAIIPNVTFAYGEGSHAEGIGTVALGEGSHAEGYGDTKIVNFEVHKMTQEIADVLINDPIFSGSLGVENTYYSTDESIMQGSGAIIGYNSSGFTGLFLYNTESQSIGNYIGNPIISYNTTYNDETMFVFQYSGSIIDDGQYISWLNSNGCAKGDYSHSEGRNTVASGDYSHAEGSSTTASGYASHSEGSSTKAEGDFSHTEGLSSIASGYASHAEGDNTTASGNSSHAEGYKTTASGYASHSEGSGTIAYGSSSHAEGNPGSLNTYQQQEQQYEWDEEGNENIYYVDNYNWEEGTNIINCVNLSIYNFSVGDGLIIEKYDEYDNLIEGPINVKIVNIDYENSQIEIDYTLYFDAQYTQLTLIRYAAIGDCSHREGSYTTASGGASHAEGSGTIASGYSSHAEGGDTTASGYYSHAEGCSGTIASGYSSHAEGGDTTASGDYSHAEGGDTTASGDYSHAEGYYTIAYGENSHAEGFLTGATGKYSHAEGYYTIASGYYSHAEGSGSIGLGDASHAEGNNTHAEGQNSHAEGSGTNSLGWASHTEGYGTITNNEAEHAEGKFNKSNTNTISSIGIGDWNNRKNAQEVMQNGDFYVINVGGYNGANINEEGVKTLQEVIEDISTSGSGGANYTAGDNISIKDNAISAKGYFYDEDNVSFATGSVTNASGWASHAEGSGTIASGYASHAEGYGTEASSSHSHAEGYGTEASGSSSHAEGENTIASSYCSHAGGYNSQANGSKSFVHGYNCTVSTNGENAHTIGIDNYVSNSGCIALGKGLTTYREYCTYLGQYNKQLPGVWNDVIAVVGDGTDSSNKRNIVVIQSGNEPAVHCRGAFKNDATWINDFGEYFEWADGNPEGEDRVGYMVQLNDDKIELAQSIDEFIGVISATAGFIGGACSLDWHGIYLRDVFGRYITDENGNPVINPEYDENKNYIPREKRPEWDIVGLLGQVVVRQDGTLKVGKYIDCKNGIATYADSGKYKVLKVINNDVALILIK